MLIVTLSSILLCFPDTHCVFLNLCYIFHSIDVPWEQLTVLLVHRLLFLKILLVATLYQEQFATQYLKKNISSSSWPLSKSLRFFAYFSASSTSTSKTGCSFAASHIPLFERCHCIEIINVIPFTSQCF